MDPPLPKVSTSGSGDLSLVAQQQIEIKATAGSHSADSPTQLQTQSTGTTVGSSNGGGDHPMLISGDQEKLDGFDQPRQMPFFKMI
jgi:hypothetical protein